MYSKEGWACPPSFHTFLTLLFLSSQKWLYGVCFEPFCIPGFWAEQHKEYSGLKNTIPEHTERKQTSKTQDNQNLSDSRFCLFFFVAFVFCFCCFSGESCRVVFGDSVFWLCVCFLCFSFFAGINFLCWSRWQTTRANERKFVCIQPDLTRTTSNHN